MSRVPLLRWLAPAATGLALLSGSLAGCLGGKNLAGGSSGVDNPEVKVAFVDANGLSASVSGTLSLYLADQNPAVDPVPLLQKQLNADSAAVLGAPDFRIDSARAYNVHLVSDDSSGALLRDLVYDPGARAFRLRDSALSGRLPLRIVPLVRYEGVLERDGAEALLRVIAPGTPYQATVVDSLFVLEGVPGDVPLVLHLLDQDGQERPLAPAQAGPGDKPRHRVDTTASVVNRPPPPAPPHNFGVNAGPDRLAIIGEEFSLLGEVAGLSGNDARLALLWRQVDPPPAAARATLESPTALQTRVAFPWPGIYRFVLSAAFGNHRSTDTVVVAVQPPPAAPVFTDPTPMNPFSEVAYTNGPPFRISWYSHVPDTLELQVSRDSGATWQTLRQNIPSYGPMEHWWEATAPHSENCFLRLLRGGYVVAVSSRFAVRAWP